MRITRTLCQRCTNRRLESAFRPSSPQYTILSAFTMRTNCDDCVRRADCAFVRVEAPVCDLIPAMQSASSLLAAERAWARKGGDNA